MDGCSLVGSCVMMATYKRMFLAFQDSSAIDDDDGFLVVGNIEDGLKVEPPKKALPAITAKGKELASKDSVQVDGDVVTILPSQGQDDGLVVKVVGEDDGLVTILD